MGYKEEYAALLEAIAQEADAIALKYFRSEAMRIERKKDGTAVTQADREVEAMARAKVAASGIALDVLGEEMGGDGATAPSANGRARMIIDPRNRRRLRQRSRPAHPLVGVSRRRRLP
jgi:fructose-1,6-bisphosphatase/inositol monophosphatase family enzyme